MNTLKPNFNKINFEPIDINFYNIHDVNKFKTMKSKLLTFNSILLNDNSKIKNYLKSKYIDKNITLQTGLMLSAYIGNYEMVKLLINKEIGYVDLYDRSALFYAENALIKNDDIIKLLEEYETC